MDMPRSDSRPVSFEEFSTPKHLEKASEQARARNYQDFLIVDVDSHHYENENYAEVFEYIDSPVLRREAMEGGGRSTGFLNTQVGMQNLAGRITRSKGRRIEKVKPGRHRDIVMTLDWMDAMGVDYSCLFPTPMLFLSAHPVPEIEVGDGAGLQPLALRAGAGARAAHRVDALPAVQRSGGGLPHGQGIRRQEGRGRLHGDVAALQVGARQRVHQDLRADRRDGQGRCRSTPPTIGTTGRWR